MRVYMQKISTCRSLFSIEKPGMRFSTMGVLPAQNAAKVAGFTLAGGGILFLVGALAVGMVIISLIPLYASDTSIDGFGEIYTIPGFTIKAIYTNVSFNFTGGAVLNVGGLSTICTRILRDRRIPGFFACLATNFTAYGPTGNLDRNSVIQRRALDDVALYEIGEIRLLFNSTCANQRANGTWFGDLRRSQNSSCYSQRANLCRTFLATPNAGNAGNQWSYVPAGFTQLVISNVTGLGCSAISVTNIFNVAFFNYATIYGRYNVTRPVINAGDCYLEAIVPQQIIRNLVEGQFNANTSVCTSTGG